MQTIKSATVIKSIEQFMKTKRKYWKVNKSTLVQQK